MEQQQILKAIRLSCEMWPDDILCEDGIKLKNKIIELLDGVVTDNIEPEISQARLTAKAKLWDRAIDLADEGKMLKYLEDELEKLSC